MHPPLAVTGVIKVTHEGERQPVCFDKPVDDLRRGAGHRSDQCVIVFVVRLGLNVGGKNVGAVADPRVLLQARPCRGDQPGAQRGRACGDRVGL